MTAMPHLLLTRPQPQAERFAATLRAEFPDLPVTIAPLMRIALSPPGPDISDGITGLIFTSENGVAGFVAGCSRRDLPVWCVGPRTAQAASRAGFGKVHIAGGDARALLDKLLRARPQGPLLHLRGTHAAADIAHALRAAEIPAQDCVVYDQVAANLSPPALAVLAKPGAVIVPLFSPRSARLFVASVGAHHLHARLHVVAISAAAAQPVANAGFAAETCVSASPDAKTMAVMAAKVIRALETCKKPR